jgi:hypothetical protein
MSLSEILDSFRDHCTLGTPLVWTNYVLFQVFFPLILALLHDLLQLKCADNIQQFLNQVLNLVLPPGPIYAVISRDEIWIKSFDILGSVFSSSVCKYKNRNWYSNIPDFFFSLVQTRHCLQK